MKETRKKKVSNSSKTLVVGGLKCMNVSFSISNSVAITETVIKTA
jgi:hypothetical protein